MFWKTKKSEFPDFHPTWTLKEPIDRDRSWLISGELEMRIFAGVEKGEEIARLVHLAPDMKRALTALVMDNSPDTVRFAKSVLAALEIRTGG